MTPSNYRRSKSLATDVARWWNQLKVERGKYLDEFPSLVKLVKTLINESYSLKEGAYTRETRLKLSKQRISLVEAIQKKSDTMKDAFFEVERILIDIMGNDLVKPLAPGTAIEQVRKEAKQLDLLFMAVKNYIKVINKAKESLKEAKESELVKSAREALVKAFRTIQDLVLQTEETINIVYEELTEQREIADLLEKKQLL
ncbi:MAG: hypothetical protein ACE5R6_12410 [Candidatus Heimdallarchaeota archaeon]